jgi:predicted DNA-binding transcriptional regulator AlpA
MNPDTPVVNNSTQSGAVNQPESTQARKSPKPFLSIREAVREYLLTRYQVEQALAQGQFPGAHRLGGNTSAWRIPRVALDRYTGKGTEGE